MTSVEIGHRARQVRRRRIAARKAIGYLALTLMAAIALIPFAWTVSTSLKNIDEVFGSYANSEAHAGAVKSSDAQAMTKGEVSLALHGKGRGWDLGVAFGKFTISRQ